MYADEQKLCLQDQVLLYNITALVVHAASPCECGGRLGHQAVAFRDTGASPPTILIFVCAHQVPPHHPRIHGAGGCPAALVVRTWVCRGMVQVGAAALVLETEGEGDATIGHCQNL